MIKNAVVKKRKTWHIFSRKTYKVQDVIRYSNEKRITSCTFFAIRITYVNLHTSRSALVVLDERVPISTRSDVPSYIGNHGMGGGGGYSVKSLPLWNCGPLLQWIIICMVQLTPRVPQSGPHGHSSVGNILHFSSWFLPILSRFLFSV